MTAFIDIEGERFGRLIASKPVRGGREVKWRCVCDCGQEITTTGSKLRSGDTSSCGCLRREVAADQGLKNVAHGHARAKRSPEYRVWASMLNRCCNDKDGNWPNYGGRGIQVCERWKSFLAFLTDMGPRPPNTTIDRKNVNGNYEPNNCRWATSEEQNGNRRNSVILEMNGKKQSLSAWAREVGLHKATISMRLRAGWSVADALTRKKREAA